MEHEEGSLAKMMADGETNPLVPVGIEGREPPPLAELRVVRAGTPPRRRGGSSLGGSPRRSVTPPRAPPPLSNIRHALQFSLKTKSFYSKFQAERTMRNAMKFLLIDTIQNSTVLEDKANLKGKEKAAQKQEKLERLEATAKSLGAAGLRRQMAEDVFRGAAGQGRTEITLKQLLEFLQGHMHCNPPCTDEHAAEFFGSEVWALGGSKWQKDVFIKRFLHLADPKNDGDVADSFKSRLWAPWSLCGFSCACLPWGECTVKLSPVTITVERSHRPLLSGGSYNSLDVFNTQSSMWMQVRENYIDFSQMATYLLEGLLLFIVCATFLYGFGSQLMRFISALVGLAWPYFRTMSLLRRSTASARIFAPELPISRTGGSVGSFEVPRLATEASGASQELINAFGQVKSGFKKPFDRRTAYESGSPEGFFGESWLKATHSFEIAKTKSPLFRITMNSEALPAGCESCCKPCTSKAWHVGAVSDIPWVHTHSNKLRLSTLFDWMFKGLVVALMFSFLTASFKRSCDDYSPCEPRSPTAEELVASVAKLPPYSNVSATNCTRPFDFSGYETHGDIEQEATDVPVSAVQEDCDRRAGLGHCDSSRPEHNAMLDQCRPTCGECPEADQATGIPSAEGLQLTCDQRCRTLSCNQFQCGLSTSPRTRQAANCSFAGDGVCDETASLCLLGTDTDCTDSQSYIDYLFFNYAQGHTRLRWLWHVAEATDDGCRHVTVLERCGACRSYDFACSAYNVTSDYPDAITSCSEIETQGMLYTTPWCPEPPAGQMPACSCLPPYLRVLPDWGAYVVAFTITLAILWGVICWRWAKIALCYAEIGAMGATTTAEQQQLKFRTKDQNTNAEIVQAVLTEKLGRAVNIWVSKPNEETDRLGKRGKITEFEYKLPAWRAFFEGNQTEKLIVYEDCIVVEKHCCRPTWQLWASKADATWDRYYVLLKDTSFIESGKVGEPFAAKLARVCLAIGFAWLCSSAMEEYITELAAGDGMQKFVERAASDVDVEKHSDKYLLGGSIRDMRLQGFYCGVILFLLFRWIAGLMDQHFLHVGCSAGGTQRGRSNPHGGRSPFYIRIKHADVMNQDYSRMKDIMRTTRKNSRAKRTQTVQDEEKRPGAESTSGQQSQPAQTVDDTTEASWRSANKMPCSSCLCSDEDKDKVVGKVKGTWNWPMQGLTKHNDTDEDKNESLTGMDVQTIEAKFNEYNTDQNDGSPDHGLSVGEIETKMWRDFRIDPDSVRALHKQHDKSGDELLDKDEFKYMMLKLAARPRLIDAGHLAGNSPSGDEKTQKSFNKYQERYYLERGIEARFKEYNDGDTGNGDSDTKRLSVEEIQAHSEIDFGIKKDDVQKWVTDNDEDGDNMLSEEEFTYMVLMLVAPELAEVSFQVDDYCPLSFPGLSVDLDWIPWGKRNVTLTRVRCDVGGNRGLMGQKHLSDETDFEVEVTRMRWLMLDQSPANVGKVQAYVIEAYAMYQLVIESQSMLGLPRDDRKFFGAVFGLSWLALRIIYLFKRARAKAHVNTIGVPAASTAAGQHKTSFPVELKASNSLIREFSVAKGVHGDPEVWATKKQAERFLPNISTDIRDPKKSPYLGRLFTFYPKPEMHRMALIGNSHFIIEQVVEDDLSDLCGLQWSAYEDQRFPVLGDEDRFRRRVLVGLVDDMCAANHSTTRVPSPALVRLAAWLAV